MSGPCTEDNRHKNLASILENIPRADQDALPLGDLCDSRVKSEPSCEACADAMCSFLKLFEAVTLTTAGTNTHPKVKAKSEAAFYFLKSLAAYFRGGLTLATNWERKGINVNILPQEVLGSGTELVRLMEHRRTIECADTSPIRHERVSQAIIKGRIKGRSEPVYLFQYDANAHQYQLIGGRMRSTDADELTVMKREIAEELPQAHLVHGQDYETKELVRDLRLQAMSPTFGAYTEYVFTFYQAFIERSQLVLGPTDRWVTYNELSRGRTSDGQRISNGNLADLENRLPGRLEGLPLSLRLVQKRALREIIKERRWELIGIIIGAIGVLLTVLFFLFGK